MSNWIKAVLITIALSVVVATILTLSIYFNVIEYLFIGGIALVGAIAAVLVVKEILDAWDSERRRR